jgi:integrase/recombinase XerD
MKIEQAINMFEIYLLSERGLARNTISSYLGDLNQLISYLAKKKILSLDQLDVDILRGYLKFLRNKLHNSPNSLSRKVSTLKSFFNFLSQRHNLTNTALLLVFPKLQKKLPHFLSEQDIEKLLEYAAKDQTNFGIRNRVMLMLLYVTGMRISELCDLRLQSINFTEGLISVHGKGDKQRMVPVLPELLDLIEHTYLKQVYPVLVGHYHSDYLFPSIYLDRVQNISRQAFWLILKKMAQGAGVSQKLSPHLLRHSLATHLLKKGANLRLLQILLGHERLATVQIYTHVDMDYLRGIYNDKHHRS